MAMHSTSGHFFGNAPQAGGRPWRRRFVDVLAGVIATPWYVKSNIAI